MGWPQPPPVDRAAAAAAVEKSRGGGHVQCRFGILSDTAQGQSQLAASIIIIIIIHQVACAAKIRVATPGPNIYL